MQAIEFESEIRDGMILVPHEHCRWAGKTVRVIVLEKEAGTMMDRPRRKPHPDIAGKGKTTGDILMPIVDESGWECL